MLTRANDSLRNDEDLARATEPAACKTFFWHRIAITHAATPIDMPGSENIRRPAQSVLSRDQDGLETGCGSGTTALLMPAYTWSHLLYLLTELHQGSAKPVFRPGSPLFSKTACIER